MNPSFLLFLCPALLLKCADSELKQSEIWAGTQWARDLPGLDRRAGSHLRSPQPMQSRGTWCFLGHRWTDTLGKAFLLIFPLLFQGPIGLDGKPVSNELLLPPARSHCAASLCATPCVSRGLFCNVMHMHGLEENWEIGRPGGCHRCLLGRCRSQEIKEGRVWPVPF